MPLGLTKLEMFEHFGRFMYLGQLAFPPRSWLEQNFVAGYSFDGLAIYMCYLCACLIMCVKMCVLVVQLKAPEAKPSLWMAAGTAWAMCGALAFVHEDMFKKPEWYINLGMQGFFGSAFILASLTAKGKTA